MYYRVLKEFLNENQYWRLLLKNLGELHLATCTVRELALKLLPGDDFLRVKGGSVETRPTLGPCDRVL
ncbi:hypothetical protein [Thermococcus sp.]|uniref:hypothetical protein n=1 Tax=Thermococcus sp. TaxID=35749 RepID=UPI002630DD36|nr:hypothetical protein [Thermococcus sp.]